MHLWDTRKAAAPLASHERVHSSRVRALCTSLSATQLSSAVPTGTLATASSDGAVKVWSIAQACERDRDLEPLAQVAVGARLTCMCAVRRKDTAGTREAARTEPQRQSSSSADPDGDGGNELTLPEPSAHGQKRKARGQVCALGEQQVLPATSFKAGKRKQQGGEAKGARKRPASGGLQATGASPAERSTGSAGGTSARLELLTQSTASVHKRKADRTPAPSGVKKRR